MAFENLKEWMSLTDKQIELLNKGDDNLFTIIKLQGERLDALSTMCSILSARLDVLSKRIDKLEPKNEEVKED